MRLLLNCQQTHQLISEAQDRELTLNEKVQSKLHMGICRSCTNFSKQMQMMRISMKKFAEMQQKKE